MKMLKEKLKFQIDDEVVINPTCDYYSDYKGCVLRIVGITRDKKDGEIEVELRDVENDDWTDGWGQVDLELFTNNEAKMRVLDEKITRQQKVITNIVESLHKEELVLIELKGERGGLMLDMGELG